MIESEEALGEAYERALELEKSGDRLAAAEAYRGILSADPDDRCGVVVRLAAMGLGETPAKAPDAYIATLFDQHADVFDVMLVDRLGYSVPLQVRQICLDLNIGPFRHVVDLGCGTGLTGEALHDKADRITGVDLSENMIEIAYDKDVYDRLFVGEAAAFLYGIGDDKPDFIVATDVLPYLGAVSQLFDGVVHALSDDGYFCFSTEVQPKEIMAGRPFAVGPKQRFAHDEDYLRCELGGKNLECLLFAPIIVRYDEGMPVHGHLVLARKQQRDRSDRPDREPS